VNFAIKSLPQAIKPIPVECVAFERVFMDGAGSSEEPAGAETSAVADDGAMATIPAVRVWGPVLPAQAHGVGALAAATSVLLKPLDEHIPTNVFCGLRQLVPDAVLPRATDDAQTLLARLSDNTFLHPSWVLAKGQGRGGRYIELNTTMYKQPRRVLWATPLVSEHIDQDGDHVIGCLCYPHYYKKSPLLQFCEAMPPAIDDLITFALGLAQPFLTPESRAARPNSCELCLYFTAFQSKMGRHRDNFVPRDLCTYLETRDPSVLRVQRNTQLANSNVLIFTMGNAPMVLQLTFPPSRCEAGDRTTYVMEPLFSVPCGNGTLFVFSPVDDLFFCHEAFFAPKTLETFGAAGYRMAFVMRWLCPDTAPTHMFYAKGRQKGQMKPTEQLVRAEALRVKANARLRRMKRGLAK
jgi:hypothetical protein